MFQGHFLNFFLDSFSAVALKKNTTQQWFQRYFQRPHCVTKVIYDGLGGNIRQDPAIYTGRFESCFVHVHKENIFFCYLLPSNNHYHKYKESLSNNKC